MKTPAYETSTGALMALLATRQFQWAGLFKITLINGGTFYYTTGDAPIAFNGNTYLTAAQAGAEIGKKGSRTAISWKIGVEVSTMQFDVMPNGGTINNQPWLDAIQQGVFDNADVTFYHAYWPQQAWSQLIQPTGVLTMFAGTVAPVQAGRSSTNFTVNSYLAYLNQQLPRGVYQAGCMNTLYDSGCTLNAAAYAVTGVAVAGTTTSQINATLAPATGYFDLGKITFTSGLNAGISRGVKNYVKGSPGSLTLMQPFPRLPATGDTFNIYPGCDRSLGTCYNKYSNQVNFRGFPFIPENTTAV